MKQFSKNTTADEFPEMHENMLVPIISFIGVSLDF
tara:strand:- start:100 stop:204 length:105 start_codon:yes stop_codon:yes gene_type:complete